LAQRLGIRQVAVVRDGHRAELWVFDCDRLRVLEPVRAGGRVARMAERELAGQTFQRGLIEGLRHESHCFVHS